MKWNTRLTNKFPCRIPIVGAPMDGIAGGALAYEVCRAGGLGFIGVGSGQSNKFVEDQIAIFRDLQQKHVISYPLCLGFLGFSAFKDDAGWQCVEKILRTHQPAVVQFFAPAITTNNIGNNDEITRKNRYPNNIIMAKNCCNCQVLAQVGTMMEAIEAVNAGVDGLIVQGSQAGGHGFRRELGNGTLSFALDVTNRFPDVPVIAAGGLADGRGLAAMIIGGCDGIVLGTRLYATIESIALDGKKQALVQANSCDDVIRTTVFDAIHNTFNPTPWPQPYDSVGALRNETVSKWDERPLDLQNELKSVDSIFVENYKIANQEGDSRTCCVLCGEGVGLVNEIIHAYDVVTKVNAEAIQILQTKPKDVFL